MQRWCVLVVMMVACSSCSFVAVRDDLSLANDNSGWREIGAGPVDDEFIYVTNGDTISVSYFSLGKPVMFGPPFLPVIPVFIFAPIAPPTPHIEGFDFFNMRIVLDLSDSVVVSQQRVRYYSDVAEIESRHDKTWHPVERRPQLRYTIEEEITRLDNFDVVFDSISSRSRTYAVPPLKLHRGKSLTFYNKDFGHAGEVMW